MPFDVPDDCRYTESHEWARRDDGTVRVGITDFAQDELGDIVFVELPDPGESITAGETFGLVESIKAVSDLYAPVSGEVTAVNDDLELAPEAVNDDPYGDGWLLEVETDDDLASLMTSVEYRDETA
jgi:glycine cleavage system H protein